MLETCIESALGGMVDLALIECQDGTENLNTWFNTNSGSEYNYDLGGLGGIGADFGDPETYLDGLLPYGDGLAYYDTVYNVVMDYRLEGDSLIIGYELGTAYELIQYEYTRQSDRTV